MLWRVRGVCWEYLQPPSSIPVTGGQQSTPKCRCSSTRLHGVTYGIHQSWQSALWKLQMSRKKHFVHPWPILFNIIRRESFHVTPCQHEWNLSLSRGSGINFTPLSDVQKAHHSLKMNSYERKWCFLFKTRYTHNIKTFASSKGILRRKS